MKNAAELAMYGSWRSAEAISACNAVSAGRAGTDTSVGVACAARQIEQWEWSGFPGGCMCTVSIVTNTQNSNTAAIAVTFRTRRRSN